MISNLKGCPGDINEVTTVLPFCETSDVAAQKAILEAMTPIAEKFIAKAKAQGEDSPRLAFLIVSERRLSRIPEFSGFSRDEGVQNLPAGLISSELSAHQMSPSGVASQWRSRPALQPTWCPIVNLRSRRVTSRSAGYDCVNNATVS